MQHPNRLSKTVLLVSAAATTMKIVFAVYLIATSDAFTARQSTTKVFRLAHYAV